MGRAIGIGVVCALAAGGCLLESHVPTDPVPLATFCDDFFIALCDPLVACGCSDAAIAECAAENRALCARFPSPALATAIDAGRVRYDGSRAARLFARMRARETGCESFVSSLDWRVRDLLSLGGTFEGTLEAGEECDPLGFELVSECRRGACAPSGSRYTCRAAVGEGEACDATHQCVDLDGVLTPERGIDRLTLRCIPSAPGDVAGTCAGWVDDGGACEGDGACWSSLCQVDRCTTRAVGEPCFSGRECASGYCGAERLCAPGGAPTGASCDDASACASHVCIAGACAPEGCGTF